MMPSEFEAQKQQMRDAGRDEIVNAHAHVNANRDELLKSASVGCFHFCEVFRPSEVLDWVDDDKCALCPRCGIDSVIGDASGFPISDKQFLQEMNGFWFS